MKKKKEKKGKKGGNNPGMRRTYFRDVTSGPMTSSHVTSLPVAPPPHIYTTVVFFVLLVFVLYRVPSVT